MIIVFIHAKIINIFTMEIDNLEKYYITSPNAF
jgi:hypothetical protein